MRFLLMSLLGSFMLGQLCPAQQPEPKSSESAAAQPRFYRLEFTVRELDNDKVVNARSYATTLSSDLRHKTSIRVGSRVPLPTSPLPKTGTGSPSLVSTQYNFYDVGVNIDASEGRDLGNGQYTLNVNADLSSLVVGNESADSIPPVVRRTTWQSPVVVPLRKASLVFSSDDPTGQRKMQLHLTVTPMS